LTAALIVTIFANLFSAWTKISPEVAMSGSYSIEFTNNSNVTFNRSVYGVQNVFGSETVGPAYNLTKSPDNVLLPGNGLQSIALEVNTASWFAAGGYHDLYCVWRNPANGQRFGVLIHAPLQVLTLGTAPYYQVMSDTTPGSAPDAEPVWQDTGQDPSAPYTWSGLAGVVIKTDPTADHQDLDVSVIINPEGVLTLGVDASG
jgi:hypothetical protein